MTLRFAAVGSEQVRHITGRARLQSLSQHKRNTHASLEGCSLLLSDPLLNHPYVAPAILCNIVRHPAMVTDRVHCRQRPTCSHTPRLDITDPKCSFGGLTDYSFRSRIQTRNV